MSDEKQPDNGTAMDDTTTEQEVQENAEKKSKSPSNSQESQNSDSENEDEQELPFPGFTAKALCMTQDHRLRFWCLKTITHPYPFLK